MEDLFTVGAVQAAPGTKVRSFLPVVNSSDKLPLVLIHGTKPGPTVVITAGVHGGEYPGIEAASRLAAELDPSDVRGCIAIIPCVNQEAFFSKSQYVNPLDGQNLNRVFPGKALGTLSERLAYTLSSLLFSQADFYMDLHSGDIHEDLVPFVIYSLGGDQEQIAKAREMASLLGVEYVVGSVSENGSFGAAAKVGVPGFLGEIGRCGLWSEDEVEAYRNGVTNVLRNIGVIEGSVTRHPVKYMKRMMGLNAGVTGMWHPVVKPGQEVRQGDLVGNIVDFFGEYLESYVAPCSGPVLYVISSLAIKIGEPLVAVGDPE